MENAREKYPDATDLTTAIHSLFSGHNFRHALIGPGVFASHGYERTHVSGLDNTLKLLAAFVSG